MSARTGVVDVDNGAQTQIQEVKKSLAWLVALQPGLGGLLPGIFQMFTSELVENVHIHKWFRGIAAPISQEGLPCRHSSKRGEGDRSGALLALQRVHCLHSNAWGITKCASHTNLKLMNFCRRKFKRACSGLQTEVRSQKLELCTSPQIAVMRLIHDLQISAHGTSALSRNCSGPDRTPMPGQSSDQRVPHVPHRVVRVRVMALVWYKSVAWVMRSTCVVGEEQGPDQILRA